jgi:hypothetical protein
MVFSLPLANLSVLLLSAFFPMYVWAANDSTNLKTVQHYIRPCIYFNHYGTPEKRDNAKKQYRFAQNDLGFYVPLHTKTWYNKDSVSLSTFHLLGTADIIQYKPQLDFINESYKIGRLSAGIRIFYSNGKKSVLYFSFAPFVSQEFRYAHQTQGRFASALIYSRTVKRNFSYRIGFARTYTFGRALHLPILGIRLGQIDKKHLNIQFPRNVSFDFPIGKKVWGSVFSRAMGGIYNVVTQDTILSPIGTLATLRRFEMLNGFQFNIRTGPNFSFYISTGFATRRRLNFSFHDNNNDKIAQTNTIEKIPNSLFLSFGFSIRFGKVKKTYNNATLYDVFDLQTINRGGFNERGTADNDIPTEIEKYNLNHLNNLKYKDIEDLVSQEY